MSQAVVVFGVKELDRQFQKLPQNVQRKMLRSSFRSSAKLVARKAKNKTPVLRGDLRRGIKVRAGKRSRNSVSINVGVDTSSLQTTDPGKTDFYAAFVELGTKHIEAESFLRNALTEEEKKVLQNIYRDIGSQL